MRKRILQLLMAACICSATANGEVIQNYEYHFDDETIASTSYHPLGWGRLSDGGVYSFSEDGRSGKCLSVTQTDSNPWDCIITPPFTGNASIYVRANSAGAYVKFRRVTGRSSSRYGWSTEEITNFETPELVEGEWVKVDLPECPEGERIGIQLHNASMDDFSADSADITAYEKLSIGSANRVGYGNINGDKYGDFEYEYDILLSNEGEVSYEPGDANYTLSHYFNSPTSESIKDIEIPEGLAAGENKTIRIKVTLHGGNEVFNPYLYVGENISGTSQSLGRITYIPYIPEMKLGVTGTSNEYFSSPYKTSEPYAPYLSFGTVYDETRREKTVTIKNTAPAAPLTVTGITATGEGFSVDFPESVTVEAGSSYDFTIKFSGTVPGIYRGELEIETGELDKLTSPLAAAVPDATKWHEGFEGEGNPQGFILGDNCELTDIVSAFGGEGHEKVMKIGGSSSNFITPKLIVSEGESLLIAGYSGYGDAAFTVEYSSDRKNWTEVYTTKANDAEAFKNKFSIENYTSSEHLWSFVSVAGIPAGEWYIRVSGTDLVIDELYGFEVAEIGTEIYINKSTVPVSGQVNKPYTASVEIVNLGNALEADGYTVGLYFDEEQFAAEESVALAAGESHIFTFSGIPHEQGEYEAAIEVKVGDDVFSTEPVNLIISAETAAGGDVVVGASTNTTQNGPVTNSGNRKEEILYTKEYITDNSDGLEEGSKISALTFRGAYMYDYGTLPTVTSDVVIYMSNSVATKLTTNDGYNYSFSDKEGMVKVYEGHVEISQMTEGGDLFTVILDEPFVYNGESIDILFECTTASVSASRSVNYYGKSKYDNGCVAYSNSLENATGGYSNYIPTIVFSVSGDIATVSGKVTHATSNAPLADVQIRLESPENIIYKTTTNENGEYTVQVLQPDKQYKLKAVKENLDDYESPEFLDLSSMAATHHFSMSGLTTGVENVVLDGLTIVSERGAIVMTAKESVNINIHNLLGQTILNLSEFTGEKRISLTPGIYIVNGRKLSVR